MANAYNKYDALACSDTVGRETPEGTKVIHPEIICPKMTVNRKPLEHPTVNLQQCINRIKVGNSCTIGCKVLESIREKE